MVDLDSVGGLVGDLDLAGTTHGVIIIFMEVLEDTTVITLDMADIMDSDIHITDMVITMDMVDMVDMETGMDMTETEITIMATDVRQITQMETIV